MRVFTLRCISILLCNKIFCQGLNGATNILDEAISPIIYQGSSPFWFCLTTFSNYPVNATIFLFFVSSVVRGYLNLRLGCRETKVWCLIWQHTIPRVIILWVYTYTYDDIISQSRIIGLLIYKLDVFNVLIIATTSGNLLLSIKFSCSL